MNEENQSTAVETPPALEPATRKAVLGAAARLFVERGYDAVSVREIVKAAGVTKPALYYYFGSKEGVALAIMRDLMQAADSIRQESFESARDIRGALVRYVNGMLAFAAQHKPDLAFGFSCWFGRSSVRELAEKTSEYDCKVNAEWIAFMQRRGMEAARAANLVRVFWALLMQELLRVAHCPRWAGEGEGVAETIAGLALDGALAWGSEQGGQRTMTSRLGGST